MALARKGSRAIQVDGGDYRWVVSPDSGYMILVVAPAVGPGQRLEVVYRYADILAEAGPGQYRIERQGRVIGPGVVEAAIRAGLGRGWRPDARVGAAFRLRDGQET